MKTNLYPTLEEWFTAKELKMIGENRCIHCGRYLPAVLSTFDVGCTEEDEPEPPFGEIKYCPSCGTQNPVVDVYDQKYAKILFP